MLSKSVLTLAEANSMIDAAFAEADLNAWKVTVAVVDDGGHLLAMRRMDGCAPVAAYIAAQKARSAALGRRETSDYETMINGGRMAMLSAPEVTGLMEGGAPLRVDGQVVAAIGVSGALPNQDAQVAKAGIAHFN